MDRHESYIERLFRHNEYNYVYDEIEQIGHEWKFWREELKRFLVFKGLINN